MATSENNQAKRKSRNVSTFLNKTYQILENPDNYYAVKWAPDGVGFVVIKEEEFSKEILPRYFKHSNYSSFVRQLNMYNFHKIREANYESHFHHENFREDNKGLLSEIRRKPQKKKKKIQDSDFDIKSEMQAHPMSSKGIINILSKQVEQPIKVKNENSPERKVFENTRHVCVSEKDQQGDGSKEKGEINNFLSEENEDDKISINNELVDQLPRYPTKEIFCPSNNNICPLPFRTSHFNIFY